MTCVHIYWFVPATDRERNIVRARGKGRRRRKFEDTTTEAVPARNFWIADEAYRYCRENGLSIKAAKMSTGSMSMN